MNDRLDLLREMLTPGNLAYALAILITGGIALCGVLLIGGPGK